MSSLSGIACPVCHGERFRPVWRNLPELRFGLSDRFSVQRCVACDTHMTQPLPVRTYLTELYERHYLPAEYVPPDRRAIAVQVEALRAGQTDLLNCWRSQRSTEVPALFYQPETAEFFADCRTILDVGAYTGENMLWLTAGGWTVIGVEPNRRAASVAQQLGHSVRSAYLEDCHLPDAAFDAAYLSQVIEHLLEPQKMLAELRRILRPGGRLLLTTPNVHSLWRYVFGPYWINWHTPFHVYHFHVRALRRMVEGMGFTTLYLRTRTPVFWLLLSIRALRDDLLYHRPYKRLFEPLQPAVARWLKRLLQLEEAKWEGDCIIGIFERTG